MTYQTNNGRNIDNYYNRFDASNGYKEVLLRDGYTTQASEINELQSIIADDRKRITSHIFSDGDVVSGGQIVVNATTGEVKAQAGEIYIDGRIWPVTAKNFVIPTAGTYAVGVRLIKEVISEHEDGTLLNPAIGSRAEGLPGAWRLKMTCAWGYSNDNEAGDFYPIYTVDDGVVRAKETPPSYDAMSQAIAQYDCDSTGTGTYISSGLVVHDLGDDANGAQNYNVTAGRFRVNGMGLEFQQDQRVIYNTAPANDEIISVPTETVAATGESTQHVDFAHTPCWLSAPISLSVPRRTTVTLEHGLVSGASDTLTPGSVIRIISVTQGGTTYTEGTDFTRVGDTINWSLSGAEPSPGATYTVEYDYYDTDTPDNLDYDGFDVDDAVEGLSIIYSYSYALPRVDRLCLNASGRFIWVQGVASSSPKVPAVPSSLLSIATVWQNWRGPEGRILKSNGVRSMMFDDFLVMQDQIAWLTSELARTRLENDITTREAGARVGMMVDPFEDDSMRDEGLTQTAAVVNGWLTLPIAATAHSLTPLSEPAVLPNTLSVALQQTSRSGSMKINPYQVFFPLPADLTISPAVDHWTQTITNTAAPVTKYFYQNRTVARTVNQTSSATSSVLSGTQLVGSSVSQSTSTSSSTSSSTSVSTRTAAAEYLRQITVNFDIDGFGGGEILDKLMFDGINVTPSDLTADENGHLSGSFTIPANVPAGTKSVVAEGRGGTLGTATFTGSGTITYRTLKTTNTVTVTNTTTVTTTNNYVNYTLVVPNTADPLAQTFILEEDAQLAAVDLFFTARGNSPVKIRIVETSNGYPTQTVLAEGSIDPTQISLTDFTRIYFDGFYKAVTLDAGQEYALVVMTDDPNTAVAIASLGDFDSINQRWITSQPYTVGVLFSSSNAATWTAHQKSDLCFRLIEAKASTTSRTVQLGSVTDLDGVTDLILKASTETPPGTGVKFVLTMPDSSEITLDEGQAVDLGGAVSGTISASAQLTSANKLSPGLAPEVQIISGVIATEGVYISRTINASGATDVTVIFDAILPSGSSVQVQLRQDDGDFEDMTLDSTSNQGDGLYEFRYTESVSSIDTIKLKLILSGTATARPILGNLRVLSTK